MTRSKIVQGFGWWFNLISCQIFFVHFWKEGQNIVFFKSETKIWQLKKQKKHLNLWRVAQLLMRGFWMRIFQYNFFFYFMKNAEKSKRKNLKHPNTHKASSGTPIWKPLSKGSSLTPLRTTFDTWLPPGPLIIYKKKYTSCHLSHVI